MLSGNMRKVYQVVLLKKHPCQMINHKLQMQFQMEVTQRQMFTFILELYVLGILAYKTISLKDAN